MIPRARLLSQCEAQFLYGLFRCQANRNQLPEATDGNPCIGFVGLGLLTLFDKVEIGAAGVDEVIKL